MYVCVCVRAFVFRTGVHNIPVAILYRTTIYVSCVGRNRQRLTIPISEFQILSHLGRYSSTSSAWLCGGGCIFCGSMGFVHDVSMCEFMLIQAPVILPSSSGHGYILEIETHANHRSHWYWSVFRRNLWAERKTKIKRLKSGGILENTHRYHHHKPLRDTREACSYAL